MRLIHRLRYLLLQRRHERELADEIESHRLMVEDQQRAAGLSEPEARNAAHRAMGNATLASEDARGVWIATWVQSVFQDLGYAARSLKSQPGFTALALLALALGTGVNTSLFTVYNAVALRPWPVRDPGSVVRISDFDGLGRFSLAEYHHLSAHSRAVAGLMIESSAFVSLDGKGDEPDTRIQFAGGNYFSLLGVDMALGRGFAAAEDRMEAPEAVAVLSYQAWQTRYGGDPGILGRRIRLNDIPFTVIGVVDKDFNEGPGHYVLWAPLASKPLVDPKAKVQMGRANSCCYMVGRLAPGVSREQARAELLALSRQFQKQIGRRPHDIRLFGTALLDRGDGTKSLYRLLAMLLAAFGLVLLLACANVSNLLLARAAARQREIAVRVSIGAGRARLVRQFLTESLLLAALGSGLGLLLAYALPSFVQRRTALVEGVDLTPDPNALTYSIGIAVLSAVLFGLAPALRATRINVSEAMKQQGAHASPRFPLRGLLLGVQVAISVTLLVGAGLLTRALWQARSLDLGYKADGVTELKVSLPAKSYDEARRRVFFDAVVQQVRPFGPVGVGQPPLEQGTMWATRKGGEYFTDLVARDVNAEYFDVLGIPVVAGRNFVPADRGLRYILVNETLARRFWPGQTPVGKSLRGYGEPSQVVGVVRDAKLDGPTATLPTFFRYADTGSLLVPSSVAKIATGAIRQAEPLARVTAAPLSDKLESRLGFKRTSAQVSVSLGALALLLATIGVYGVISYSVEQRRREIGIRMALGARSGEILGLILGLNAVPVVCGLAAGLAVSLVASKVLESFLYGISRFDPLAYAAVLAVMLAAAAAACVIPARRATSIAPVEALRHE